MHSFGNSAQNLKMKISHPRFLTLGSPKALDSEFPACLRKENSEKHGDAAGCSEKRSFFKFPEVCELFSGSATQLIIPVYVMNIDLDIWLSSRI